MPQKKVTRVEFPTKPLLPSQSTLLKRVAAYARVSTVKDAQENSLQSQQEYFTEYIRQHPDWVFAGMYTDDGVSGLSIRRRDGFNRMVNDALDGKIDLILTKSLSRFARNTVDALTTIRKLKAAGVAVYFQRENINTMDSAGEFLLTLMSSFAEEESRSISENVTWAVRRRYAQGIYHLPGLLLGYQRSPVGEIQVDEAGARVVRFIYLLALAGVSSTDICRILMEYNIPSPGESEVWESKTVRSILKNEKYMGDAILQKQVTVDFLTKTSKPNEGEAPQYYVENGIPVLLAKPCGRKCKSNGRMPVAGTALSHPSPTKSSAETAAVGMGEKHGIPQPTGTLSGSAITGKPDIPSAVAVTFMPRNWIPQSATLCSACCRRTNTLLLTVRICWSKRSEPFRQRRGLL